MITATLSVYSTSGSTVKQTSVSFDPLTWKTDTNLKQLVREYQDEVKHYDKKSFFNDSEETHYVNLESTRTEDERLCAQIDEQLESLN